MMGEMPFALPPTRPEDPRPVWTGREFVVGDLHTPVVVYEGDVSGWDDSLTALHEDESANGSHFIDVASRARAIDNLVRFGVGPTASIMEIGVSSGHLLADIRGRFPQATLVGTDYTLGTLLALSSRIQGIPLIRMDLTQSPIPDEAVDAAVLLNVLEHIDDDRAAIAHCYRMLKPGGIVVIEVPAGPGLFDDYDRELMHFRRYASDDLNAKVKAAGFEVVDASHIGCLIYPAFWASKKLSRRRAKRTVSRPATSRVRTAIRATAKANGVGHWLMSTEAALARVIKLPFGIRCVAVGRKPRR